MAATQTFDRPVVLVTGANSGIGAAGARVLRRHGARLVLAAPALALFGEGARDDEHTHHVAADVTDAAACEAMAAAAIDRFGRLDIVWANAGVAGFGPVAQIDPVAFAHTLDVNLLGTFRTVRAALPLLQATRGHIAVTASAASFSHLPGMAAYAASKAGLEAFCNALRIEQAHHGVTVGALHPLWITTPMVQDMGACGAFRALRAALPAPLRKETGVDEAAEAIVAGILRRDRRVCVPGMVRWLHRARNLLHSTLGERDLLRAAPDIERAFDADVAREGAMGASMSARAREAQHPQAIGGALR